MKRIQKSIWGRQFGIADDGRALNPTGYLAGDWGAQMPLPDLNNVVLFDDFLGATIDQSWAVLKGTDGAAANFAIAVAKGGTVAGTTGATSTTMAGAGIQLHAALNFQADSGLLEFGIRVKTSLITGLSLFVGLTNQTASLQAPIQSSGSANAFTANANDAVGFLFDTSMTTADWWCVGAKGGVLATGIDCGSAPVAAAYDYLAISIDKTGIATFFRNGLQVGSSMPNAVTVTVPLTPVVTAFDRIAVSKTITVDKILAANASV